MCVCAMAYAMFIYTSCAKPTGAVLLAVALLHELKLVLVLATNGQTQDTSPSSNRFYQLRAWIQLAY